MHRAADWPMSIVDWLDLAGTGHRVLTDTPPEPLEVTAMAGTGRSGPSPDIVDRLLAAAEQDEGVPTALAQALFIEAADAITLLRSLLEPGSEGRLEDMKPEGPA